MTDLELSPAAIAAIDKVTKLLALANDGRGNEAEAQNAMDLAHRILEQHNLDIAAIEQRSQAKTNTRKDEQKSGGLYKWQRAVWEQTAKLNMCVYQSIRGLTAGSKYEQRIIGRTENVLMTRLMGEYLQGAIERIAAEWAKDQGYVSRFVKPAIIYREGMASTICERLSSLHYQRVQENRRKEAEARAAQPTGTGTSIVLASVIQTEADLNQDYLNGYEPGTTSRRRAENQAAWAAYEAKQLALANEKAARRLIDPQFDLECKAEEAAQARRQAKEDAKWNRRTYSARETAEDRRRNTSEYRSGREAGRNVSLDQQVADKSAPKLT